MAQFDFVADYNDQYKGYSPLPAGEYKFQITDSDVVVPSTGDGKMLVLTYEVIADPQFDGRRVIDRLCYVHSKSETQASAIQKINTIFFLTGTKGTKDTAQLHGKTLSLLIGVKDDEKYGPQNYIKKYLPFNDREDDTDEEQPRTGKKPSFVK
jgi:hypothetical protein